MIRKEPNTIAIRNSTEEIVRAVTNRIRLLIIASSLAVALTFGLSFYFSLVSASSAVTRQVPELEMVVGRFKTILLINTVAFAAIIILSFIILSALVTSRMFKPLGTIYEGLRSMKRGVLPTGLETSEEGPFAGIESALRDVVASLQERETREIKELSSYAESANYDEAVVHDVLSKLLKEKRDFLGFESDEKETAVPRAAEAGPSIFMQPVE
jgi:hypothetical protein